ncbi:MAG TPA: PDZ domain-containing protein [Steroidobacteraceae bacterium]|nr:PDZ domain-containing protein [Steroidobacteraceae bacterium]
MKLYARWGRFGLILSLLPLLYARAAAPPDPGAILREMYEASGGAAWNRLAGVELTGKYDLGGLQGTFDKLIDFRTGRDVLRYDVGITRGEEANTPDHGWWVDEKGLPTIQEAPEAKADSATRSYEDRNGWFHPDATVRMSYAGRRADNSRTFDLIRLHPPGGRDLTLWIDTGTHRLDRVVMLDADQRQSTTYFSDYCQTKGVWLPFRQRQSTGDAANDVIMTIDGLHLKSRMDDADFAPPASVIRDSRLLHGATSTTIPFTPRDGLIVIQVSIDDGPPLPFVLDSGGLNLITPEAAKKLHVQMRGNLGVNGVGTKAFDAHFARVKRYRLGSAELLEQRFLVIPLPSVLTDRGGREPIAGLVGYEIFRRFRVTIDYHRRRLTLASPSTEATGERLQLFFDSRTPLVKASIDGVEGYFGIDTGDDGAVTLFKSFYVAHRFPIALPGIRSAQGGVGGKTYTLLTRVSSLALGRLAISHPLTVLNFAAAGAFASSLTAGNLGSQVFQNFVMTFDYEHRALYLRKSADFGYEMRYNRSGLHLDLNHRGKVAVTAVNPGSPADLAGLKPGDRILAIDHHSVADEDPIAVERQFTQPAGTRHQLEILRGGARRRTELTLRELLPPSGRLSRGT